MAEAKNIESFKWGKKRGIGGRNKAVQFYESFTYDGLDYTLYDSVYLYKEDQPLPYIGKLIKIWENPDKAKWVKVLWFFRPSEISVHLVDESTEPNEVFLASGEGKGLANVNPLATISGKCNVVCISKDRRNPQPSDQDLQMADFVFYRTFDVEQCIIGDKFVDKIAGIDVKFIFNQMCSLKHSPIHNSVADDTCAGETAKAISKENEDLKVDEKLKSTENLGELDERSHKKVKLDCSVKVSNEKNKNGLTPNRDSDRNDSEDKSRCGTNPNGTSENSSTEPKVDDELTKPSSRHPNDGIETDGDEASEVADRADFVSGVLQFPPAFLSFCLSLGTWSSNAHQGKDHWG
ncbi:protein ANTI-SILENCING 1-like [Hibiscus syriacus]|uniref:protein ANTI-SILENCING 1-like n=1 Tax=Hibiscus syriacus TaxID=106335 RepID=UPI0019234B1F|nr:protein ANTI-SILENCING 1-like [Hibiscus syriacus]